MIHVTTRINLKIIILHERSWTKTAYHISSVQSLRHVWLFMTSWTAARQASLFITNFQSLLKLMSIELVMPSNHLILSCSLLLPSIFPSISVFSNELALCIRWPKYQSFNISPSNEYLVCKYWVGQKFHLRLSIRSCRKTQINFLGSPIYFGEASNKKMYHLYW